jgi:FkbH-like protein
MKTIANAPATGSVSAAYGAFELSWLPADADWSRKLKEVESSCRGGDAWTALVSLANTRMDFIRTIRLDRALLKCFGNNGPTSVSTRAIRLAVLGSSTVSHLLPAIRVAALRRGIWLQTYETGYGQYLQELADAASKLHAFRPNTVLFALDTAHVMSGLSPAADAVEADAFLSGSVMRISEAWRIAREAFRCPIIQQALLPVLPPLLGSNEHRLPGSGQAMALRLNAELRRITLEGNADLLPIDSRVAVDGLHRWYDPMLWYHAKQEISPAAGPLYGDLLGRILAAQQGLSKKCLILDLDNTLWGGVIGDDGLEGIVLGNGSARGEAFAAFQRYVVDMAKRGIILAVCSKNDEEKALTPFTEHPEMILKREDIACFVANWTDKAANIRRIAQQLAIGLDSLVFVDDNPFERNLVRQELPMVAVPELPASPALFARCLADAGYFESLAVTVEDRQRARQYQANAAREALVASATDIPAYLRSLDMKLQWRRFDVIGLQRCVQLINKTNQFNLTTRRYSEDDIRAVMADKRALGLQFRLVDRFGDNGIIAIVIGRLDAGGDLLLDTWLMSCRVLGRQVEEAVLSVIVGQARRLGASQIYGEYRPTAKNTMVKDHYQRLGFTVLREGKDGASTSRLNLSSYNPGNFCMEIIAIRDEN